MFTTIQKWGNSSAVRLPKAIMQALQLRDNDRIQLVPEGDRIILMPAKPKRKTLEELFAGWDGELPEAYDWGPLEEPVGRELL